MGTGDKAVVEPLHGDPSCALMAVLFSKFCEMTWNNPMDPSLPETIVVRSGFESVGQGVSQSGPEKAAN
jgi:hypothetical protein